MMPSSSCDLLRKAFLDDLKKVEKRMAKVLPEELSSATKQDYLRLHKQHGQKDNSRPALSLCRLNQMHDTCPALRGQLIKERKTISAQCEATVETFLKEDGTEVEDLELLAALKLPALLAVEREDLPKEVAERAIKVMDSPRTPIEVALVAATAWAKTNIKAEGFQGSPSRNAASVASLFLSHLAARVGFSEICLVEGILNSGNLRILLDRPLGSELLRSCILKSSGLAAANYQSFQNVKILSARMREIAAKLGTDFGAKEREVYQGLFGSDTEGFRKLLAAVKTNRENPLRGVPDLMTETFDNLLESVRLAEGQKVHKALVEKLLQKNMSLMNWNMKAKYPELFTLLPRVGSKVVLEANPGFAAGLAQSFKSNYLSPSGASVYRIMLKEISFDDWKRHFLKVQVENLCHPDDSLIRTNAKSHWLMATLKSMKGSQEVLLEELEQTDQYDCVFAASAALQIVTIGREQGTILALSPPLMEKVKRALAHADVNVRSAAFAALCHHQQKAVPPTAEELGEANAFLKDNLTVDNPSFRQCLLSDFATLIVRVRDPLVFRLKKKKLGDEEGVLLVLLDEMISMLFRNLYPGANYQRQVTALNLLQLLNQCLFDFKSGLGMNKGSGNGDPKELIAHCQNELNLLQFYCSTNLNALLSSSMYYMSNVQILTTELLQAFKPTLDQMIAVTSKALDLICSPKFAECESGAALLSLCQKWSNDEVFKRIYDGIVVKSALLKAALPAIDTVTCWSEVLMEAYSSLLSMCDTNFLFVTKECPLHGLFTALRACFCGDKSKIKPDFNGRLITTLQLGSKTMLQKLSPSENNASFGDMGRAIDALIGDEEDNSGVEISEEHQLVLACSWLNLKEVSLLAGHLVKNSDLGEKGGLSVEMATDCGLLLETCLTKCRHKGAIESTNAACLEFSSRLLSSNKKEFRAIPMAILNRVLAEIEGYSASVTRRAAGLPMLIQKIVASEARAKSLPMLTITIEKLLEICRKKEENESAVETRDQAQSHVMHILRSLVNDSCLSHEMGRYLSPILRVSVEHFSSPHWAVRNASLQLFGAVVPRVLGQKKVRNEESLHNALTLPEFLCRYSDVEPFLLQQLRLADKAVLVNPTLVPLLSMLSRICPGGVSADQERQSTANFKSAFFAHFGSSVINVRMLAAKAFAAFTSNEDFAKEVENVLNLLSDPKLPTNMQNGLLHVLKELLKLGVDEYKLGEVKEMLTSKVASVSKIEMKCLVNESLWIDLLNRYSPNIALPATRSEKQLFEPGYAESLHIDYHPVKGKEEETKATDVNNTDEAFEFLKNHSNDVVSLVDLLSHIIEKPYTTTTLFEDLCTAICSETNAQNLLQDAETAMSLHDALTFEEKARNSPSGCELAALALAFTSMLHQPDFSMFFGAAESPYVATLMELSERLLESSQPKKVETVRISAAKALATMRVVFQERSVKSDFPLVLQYGFANMLNGAILLLADEDADIRAIVVEFASALGRKGTEDCMNAPLALRNLIKFGLNELGECFEWFEPVLEVFFSPWRENPSEAVERGLRREYLFESGEGINVFAENVTLNIVFSEALEIWLRGNPTQKMDLNLDVEKVVEASEELFVRFGGEDLESLGVLWTPQGYLAMTRLFNFLRLIELFPERICRPRENDGKRDLKTTIEKLRKKLLHYY